MRIGSNDTRIAIKKAVWIVFGTVAVWGLVPLVGGRTLTDVLMSESGISLRAAEILVSILVALLGGLAMATSFLLPGGGAMQGEAIAAHRGQSKTEMSHGTMGDPHLVVTPRRRAALGEGGLHAEPIPQTSRFLGDASLKW